MSSLIDRFFEWVMDRVDRVKWRYATPAEQTRYDRDPRWQYMGDGWNRRRP